MKIFFFFFFFILHLFSGPVSCFNVSGYPGGSVMIYCNHQQSGALNTFFCKVKPKECIYAQIQNTSVFLGKVSLYDSPGVLIVMYRNLSLQDAGLYQCGETGGWSHDVNLKVNEDPCCLGSNSVAGYLGETVTISCSYPEEFKTNYKFLFKQDGQSFTEVIRMTDTQRGRLSISDDRSSAVLSVRISDVREADGGVYYCGAGIGGEFISYNSIFGKIQLRVTEQEKSTLAEKTAPASSTTVEKPTETNSRTTLTASTAVTSDEEHFSSSVIIITVCVCVALLLIGGSTLIYYKLRYSALSCRRSGTKNADDVDYENHPHGNQKNISMDPIYENIDFKNSELDLLYASINPIPSKEI
ncbi:hypothetical protein SRHO_G00177520 [Serrasalmus rhombeus]